MHFLFVWIFALTMLVQADDLPDLQASPTPVDITPDNTSDIFAMVDRQATAESDFRQWPLDASKGNAASLETTTVIVKYPYQNIHVLAYVYQLADGRAGLPWMTYVWIDRGKKFQTIGVSPTPLVTLPEYSSNRWTSLNSITPAEWSEIDKIALHISELPLRTSDKEVQSKRIRVTRRVHPSPEKIMLQGGTAAIHELAWTDGTPVSIVESARKSKPNNR